MTMMTHEKNSDFETGAANLKDGFWYEFTDGDDEIAVHGSAWSGQETIYFNDEKVAEKRNLTSLKEEHIFEKDGHTYRVQLITTSLLKMQVMCQVWKDDVMLGSQTKGLITKVDSRKLFWGGLLFVLAFFGLGYIVGAIAAGTLFK